MGACSEDERPVRDADEVDAGEDEPPPLPAPNTQTVMAVVGPEGARLAHPTGASLEVPPGALAEPVELSITGIAAPAAFGSAALGQAFVLGPEGQEFLRPIKLQVPFDAARVPAGANAQDALVMIAPDGSDEFAALETTLQLAEGQLEAETAHFSVVVPIIPATPNPLRITSKAALPDATVGSAYGPVQLEVSGAKAPARWEVVRGALPAGLALSSAGALSGTPSSAGTSTFTVRVSDAAGYKLEKALSLLVHAAASNPTPVLTALSPTSAAQGSSVALVLTGSNFVPGALVYLGELLVGEATYTSATRIDALLSAAELATAGTFSVRVVNPAPGGGSSQSLSFVVEPAQLNPLPSVSSVDTPFIALGASDTQISVFGGSFVSGAQVVIGGAGGQALVTSFVATDELSAIVPASFLSTAGTLSVHVFNPAPGGGTSTTSASISVGETHPVPAISSLDPNTAVAGRGRMLLTLHGTGFVDGAKVFFDDVSLVVTVSTPELASTTIPSDLLDTAGSFGVVLVNPGPGGGASNELSFVVTEPPADAGAGDAGSEEPSDAGAQDAGEGELDGGVEDGGLGGLDGSVEPDGGEPSNDAGFESDAGAAAEPEELVDGLEIEVFAVDDSYLYFKGMEGGLQRLPLAGGLPENVPGFTGFYSGQLQFVGDYVYYSNQVDTLLRRSTAGGSEEVVATTPSPFALSSWTVAGNTAYVHYGNPARIDAAPVTGGALSPVLSSGAGSIVAADSKYIMFRVYSGGQNLWKTRVDGSDTSLLLPGVNAQLGALEGGVFYYASGAGIDRVDIATGAASNTHIAGSGYVSSMVLAGSELYYVEANELKVVAKDGGSPRTLASAGNGRVVVDAEHVYFSSMYPDPGVFRLPR
jgi:hypothetical protein